MSEKTESAGEEGGVNKERVRGRRRCLNEMRILAKGKGSIGDFCHIYCVHYF